MVGDYLLIPEDPMGRHGHYNWGRGRLSWFKTRTPVVRWGHKANIFHPPLMHAHIMSCRATDFGMVIYLGEWKV